MDSTKIAPPRTVGFWGTSLFPLNGMIGAGIFALPAVLVAAVGNFAPWMMLVGGILFLPLALCYAWMASRFEHSGGSVLYGEAAFGRFVGFQAGWARYASAIVTAAANMHVMIAYLAAIFPWLGEPGVTPVAAGIGLALITIVNLYGMRASVGTLGVMTAIKLLPLGALIVSALFAGGDTGAVTLPQFSQVETVILLTFYAFIGFEGVVEAAGEFKHPKRDVPLSIVTMVSGVTLLYMAIIWAFNAIGPEFAGEDNALAGVAGASMGQLGSLAIVVAASFSIGANNFASGGAQPRLMYGMAEYSQVRVVDTDGVRYDDVPEKKGMELELYECPTVHVTGGRARLLSGQESPQDRPQRRRSQRDEPAGLAEETLKASLASTSMGRIFLADDHV